MVVAVVVIAVKGGQFCLCAWLVTIIIIETINKRTILE
jgi:hypothetical protein